MITQEVKEYLKKSVLCWLATCDENYIPNVSPKEIFILYDEDTLLIANIASPRSIKNILSNPNVCVSFVDIFVQKGFKIKGRAIVFNRKAPQFELYFPSLVELAGDKFPISSIIEVKIDEIEKIVAPSYSLYPEATTEEGQIENAMKAYHVKANY